MKNVLFSFVGVLIASVIIISLISDIPEPIVVRAELAQFRGSGNKRIENTGADENFNINNSINSDNTEYLDGNKVYHLSEMDLEEYRIRNSVGDKERDVMRYWIKDGELSEELDEYINADDDEEEMYTYECGIIKDELKKRGRLPVEDKYYEVTSGYGFREDPFNRDNTEFHKGIDIAGPGINGRAIMPVLSGVIIEKSADKSRGNYIVVDHGGFKSLYAHLEGFGRINRNDEVDIDQVIGYVGTTGRSTGPHLHLEFLIDDNNVDPEPFMDMLMGGSDVESNGGKQNDEYNILEPLDDSGESEYGEHDGSRRENDE